MTKVLLLFIFPLFSFSQIKVDTIYWKEGRKLDFIDFKGTPIDDVNEILRLSQGLECKLFPTYGGYYIQTRSVLNKELSWIKEDSKTSENLRYAQILFDIYGLHSLILKNKLKQLTEKKRLDVREYEALQYEVDRDLNQYIDKFRTDMMKFDNVDKLIEWEIKVLNEIQNTPRVYSQFEESSTGWGVFIGIGYINMSGKTSQYFTNPLGLNYGFDFDFSTNRLFINGTLGGNKAKQDFLHNGTWKENMKTSGTLIEVGYGRIFKVNSLKIIPYFGVNLLEFTLKKREQVGDNLPSLTGYSPNIGIMLDYIFKTKRNILTDKTDFYLKSKFSFGATNFKNDYLGTYINFQSNIGFISRRIKVINKQF